MSKTYEVSGLRIFTIGAVCAILGGGAVYLHQEREDRQAEAAATSTTNVGPTLPPGVSGGPSTETTLVLPATTTTAASNVIRYSLSGVTCYGEPVAFVTGEEDVVMALDGDGNRTVPTHSALKAMNRAASAKTGTPVDFYTSIATGTRQDASEFMTDIFSANGQPMPTSFDDLPGFAGVVGTNCVVPAPAQ